MEVARDIGAPRAGAMQVSELAGVIRQALRSSLPRAVRVEGELANVTRHASGHLYLTLRDDQAAIRGVMFRSVARFLRFTPENGQRVEVRGEVTLYAARGDVQLVLESMQVAGLGARMAAFEALKERLRQAGWLAPERKRALPLLPRQIGLVTSLQGAALHDVLGILEERAPNVRVLVSATPVQGEGAARHIARAIERLGRAQTSDVVIVARGGGALEDLWEWNAEAVARAIVECPVPVVAGIGHESDVTLADLVADVRAATPSHAAELVVPRRADLEAQVASAALGLTRRLQQVLDRRRERLVAAEERGQWRYPHRWARDYVLQLDARLEGLCRGLRVLADRCAVKVTEATERLLRTGPAPLAGNRRRLARTSEELERRLAAQLSHRGQRLSLFRAKLEALGPSQVLDRGYALVRRPPDGTVVSRAATAHPGERLAIHWADGAALVSLEEVQVDPKWTQHGEQGDE